MGSKRYRRPPGLGWLLALILVPLSLGAIGYAASDEPEDVGFAVPSVAATATLTAPSAPPVTAASPSLALSIVRNGNDVTVTGDLPDPTARAGLVEALKTALGPDITINDQTNIKAGAGTPDIVALGTVFTAGNAIPDLNVQWDADSVTLGGTAVDETTKAAVESAVTEAWPNARLDSRIQVGP